jgi:hypothetical protein
LFLGISICNWSFKLVLTNFVLNWSKLVGSDKTVKIDWFDWFCTGAAPTPQNMKKKTKNKRPDYSKT